jgi:hypothetical protein
MKPWYWEGNVQATLVASLAAGGWVIDRASNTATREAGIDVVAHWPTGQQLFVEVKGYPSTVYEGGTRAGVPKPTQPATQARQYFAGLLLEAVLLQNTHPRAAVAICVPDFGTYRTLLERCNRTLQRLGLGTFVVMADGRVFEPARAYPTG